MMRDFIFHSPAGKGLAFFDLLWAGMVFVCLVHLLNMRSVIEHPKTVHFLVKGFKVGKNLVRHFYHIH